MKYFIIVASRDYVQKGVKGGFAQADHGKKAPMKRLSQGDKIIYYSSKENFGDSQPFQKFTAIGEVVDEAPYIGEMSTSDFKPYRRNVDYFQSEEVGVKPLIPKFEFVKDTKKWGFPFIRGFFEISQKDFLLIEKLMCGVK